MPLTPAHAALAWPLSAISPRLPVAALVIGSLSPDFEYLLRLAPRGAFGHTLMGVAVFCVPISLAVWALYERFARAALARALPAAMGRLLARPGDARKESRLAHTGPAAIAALAGALSHVAWDSFTHASGWAVRMMPALAESVGGVPVYKLLQHGSTLIGLVVVVLWARVRSGTLPRGDNETRSRWPLAVLGLGALAGAALNATRVLDRGLPQLLGHAAVGGMVGLVLATVAVVIISRTRDG